MQSSLKKEAGAAAATLKFSQTYRLVMLLIVAGAGVLAPVFNAVATILPLFFPRIAIALRPLVDKDYKKGTDGNASEDDGV